MIYCPVMVLNIALCINKKYTEPCRILISSILTFSRASVIFHVLHSDLDEKAMNLLKKSNGGKGFQINFYKCSLDKKDFIIRRNDYLTLETYLRFLLPELLKNVHTVLYLDSDILCTADFSHLFEVDLTNRAAAMVPDMTYSDISNFNRLQYPIEDGYYNAGVILFNLDYMRQNSVSEKLTAYIKENPQRCLKHDQDAINAVLHGKIKELPASYNFQHRFFNICDETEKHHNPTYKQNMTAAQPQEPLIDSAKRNEIMTSMRETVFVHFCAAQKPWHKECAMPFTEAWREFYKKEFGVLKLRSCYKGPKRIKVTVHHILSRFGLMKKVTYEVYAEKGYESERRFMNSLFPAPARKNDCNKE